MDVPIVGDARNVLKKMLEVVEEEKTILREYKQGIAEWLHQLADWKKKFPLGYTRDRTLKPQYVIERIYELTKGKAIIATEVGQNQMWTAQFYKFMKPRTILTSGGLGTMGYGFPAALGAQAAHPDMLVVDIAGDGSIQMNIQELATAVQYCLPVKVVILNNGCLGMVRQWQQFFYEKRYSCSLLQCTPDFVKLAEAYGAVGYEIEDEKEVDKVLKKAFSNGRPTFIDVHVDPEECVYPMVPAGAPLNEMVLV